MAIRTDFTYNMEVSPRIITVLAPSVEATLQDIHDTITEYEDSSEGGQYARLILSAGKEDLGGGVTVGQTSTLQDAQLQFEGRTTLTESGAVSTSDTTGTLLNAVGGLFVTNGVTRGDTVFNNVTGSMGTILEITDENNLISQVLSGGARATWLNTDTYTIYENIQCEITGGNLVAIDSVGATISPVLQSPNTNVVRSSSSSATTQNQRQLEAGLFTEGVVVDSIGGVAGTGNDSNGNPIGTRVAPSNNMTDALQIAVNRGQKVFTIIGTWVVAGVDLSAGYTFRSTNPLSSTVVFDVSANTANVDCNNLIVTGSFDGNNYLNECIVAAVTGFQGLIFNAAVVGPIGLGAGATSLLITAAGTTGVDTVFDFAGNAATLGMAEWYGGAKLTNKTSGEKCSISSMGGSIEIDSTCTAGGIEISGDASIIDNGSVPPVDNTNVTEIWGSQVEGTFTAAEVLRIVASATAGKASGLDTLNPVFRDINDTKDRITATTDANGNRTAVTLVGS